MAPMALFSSPRPRAKRSPVPTDAGHLDAMARLLRVWGENAFDIDQIDATSFGERCEAWARHVLTGSPPPSVRKKSFGDADGSAPETRRHYADLLKELKVHRKNEASFVTQTLSGLKGAVWDVVTHLREAASGYARDDRVMQAQLSRLEVVLESDDVNAIRNAASETVRIVSDNIAARQERHTQQLAALGTRMKTLESSLVEVKSLNNMDALTGLHNRGALDETLPRLVTMAALSQEPVSLLMVDIDHFKKINDNHGHPAGDAVLRSFGDALVRAFPRKSDFLARYGGEEFCVVLPNTSLADAKRLAERFLEELRILVIRYEQASLQITASIGVAMVSLSESSEGAITRADRALYAAKGKGRDRVMLAEPPGFRT